MELPVRTAPFFLTNSNDTTSKFVIKVCNHLFTLNFYITEVSHVVQVRAEDLKASAQIRRYADGSNLSFIIFRNNS